MGVCPLACRDEILLAGGPLFAFEEVYMKLVDKYISLKKKYPSYLILIKCGSFYNTYFDDAIILSCLCNYKIINNKVGFPISSLDKVTGV